jgi:hypothetical protein
MSGSCPFSNSSALDSSTPCWMGPIIILCQKCMDLCHLVPLALLNSH